MLADPKLLTIVGGNVAATVTLADAVPPVPPSVDVIAPVVLFLTPVEVLVTFALKVHDALPASEAPLKLMVPDPAVAVMVPPPQLPVSPFGVEMTRPAGSVSVKPTPVSDGDAFGFCKVKVSDVEAFSAMLAAPNALPIVGGETPDTPPVAWNVSGVVVRVRLPAVVATAPKEPDEDSAPTVNGPIGVMRP
jgi:hypothetical protein